MLKNVKGLYDLGFAIHLIKPKSKMPVKSGWTTGPREKWSSLKESYKPGMNVGVRLGLPSKIDGKYLAVIDCDVKSEKPKHLEQLKEKLKDLFPDGTNAPVVLSGRGNGSMHIYVLTEKPARPFRLSQSADKVKVFMPSVDPSKHEKKTMAPEDISKGFRLRPAWEISIMGDGQQVVLPPSIHPDSKKPYKWEDPLGFDKDLMPVMNFAGVDSHKKTEKDDDFEFVVDEPLLFSSSLPAETIDLIVHGTGCEDRSAALFLVVKDMVRAGFTENQILTVLTDRENFLGQTGYDHAKTSKRSRAARWVRDFTFKKAKRQALLLEEFDAEIVEDAPKLTPEEAEAQTKELVTEGDWRKKLGRSKNGSVLSTFKNVKMILENVLQGQFIARNEFSVEDIWTQDTPWGCKKGAVVKDDDVIRIKDYLTHKWKLEPATNKIEEVIIALAISNNFHPVREYLNGLEWDGVARIDSWLKTYLRAEGPDDYLAVVGRKTLLGMVGRIYEPGCKFDNVLILEGDQGVGKSTTARVLAGDDWFSDSDLNIGDKDAVVNMQGVWVYELGELSAMSRFDVRRLKEFVSRKTDKIRPPYGKRTINYPRQSIFIGTTNDEEYLKDKTGNRRYWPVKVGKVRIRKLEKDREQLLAEAAARFQMGETLWIDDKRVEAVVKVEQGLRVEHDELEDQLREFLHNPDEAFPTEAFRVTDLFSLAPCLVGVKNDKPTQMRIAHALKTLGYERKFKMVKGVLARWWCPKDDLST